MRFRWGKFPEDSRFNPEAEGWLALPETNPSAMHWLAQPAALGLLLVWLLLAFLVFPLELLTPQVIRISDTVFQIRYPVYEAVTWPLIATLLVIFILFFPAHEFIHALSCPSWGMSANTILGIWLAKGFFYVHHMGPMRRNRFLFVLSAPYAALSLLPLTLIAFLKTAGSTPEVMISLAWLSLLGSVLAGGDLVSAWSLLSLVPNAALVRNQGQRSYWKPV